MLELVLKSQNQGFKISFDMSHILVIGCKNGKLYIKWNKTNKQKRKTGLFFKGLREYLYPICVKCLVHGII